MEVRFAMCDTDNTERIVTHQVLADAAIREELVSKIAILVEWLNASPRSSRRFVGGDTAIRGDKAAYHRVTFLFCILVIKECTSHLHRWHYSPFE